MMRTCVDRVRAVLPPLEAAAELSSRYKGKHGKVCVVGGCAEYTGAPYFAAQAALHVGADLSHVFCAAGAAPVIKGYSPDLIVHGYLQEGAAATRDEEGVEKVLQWLPSMHAMVCGPGLGRSAGMQQAVCQLIPAAAERGLCLVLDGDALQRDVVDAVRGRGARTVLTPNANELRRLLEWFVPGAALPTLAGVQTHGRASADGVRVATGVNDEVHGGVQALADALQVTVFAKGPVDMICAHGGTHVVYCPTMPSSPRRCGGQGDVVAGMLGAVLPWVLRDVDGACSAHSEVAARMQEACEAVSIITRHAAARSFAMHHRATSASRMLDHIGPFLAQVETEQHDQ